MYGCGHKDTAIKYGHEMCSQNMIVIYGHKMKL